MISLAVGSILPEAVGILLDYTPEELVLVPPVDGTGLGPQALAVAPARTPDDARSDPNPAVCGRIRSDGQLPPRGLDTGPAPLEAAAPSRPGYPLR